MHLTLVNKSKKVDTGVAHPETEKMEMRKWIQHILRNYVSIIVIVFILFKVIFEVCLVRGSSMYPTYKNGDVVLIMRLYKAPVRGNVVVARITPREGHEGEVSTTLLKRIIAVAGDTIEVDKANQQVILNGEILDEPYIKAGYFRDGDMNGSVTVPEGYVFVMGDNRPNSTDSRYDAVGLVSEKEIVGTILFRIFHSPLS